MSDAVIQKSLIDIEQNLRKLESARNQVGKITNKSNELINSISSVLKSINAIKESFESDENYLINHVNERLKKFSDNLDNGAIRANKKTLEIASSFTKSVEGSISEMKEFQYNLSEIQQTIIDLEMDGSLYKIRQELSSITEIINTNQINNTKELNAIRSELNSSRIRQEKASKLILIALVIGFFMVFALIFMTKYN